MMEYPLSLMTKFTIKRLSWVKDHIVLKKIYNSDLYLSDSSEFNYKLRGKSVLEVLQLHWKEFKEVKPYKNPKNATEFQKKKTVYVPIVSGICFFLLRFVLNFLLESN